MKQAESGLQDTITHGSRRQHKIIPMPGTPSICDALPGVCVRVCVGGGGGRHVSKPVIEEARPSDPLPFAETRNWQRTDECVANKTQHHPSTLEEVAERQSQETPITNERVEEWYGRGGGRLGRYVAGEDTIVDRQMTECCHKGGHYY